MNKSNFAWIPLTGCLMFGFVNSAAAAEISVSSVSASSTFYTYSVDNLINNSGISGDYHNGDFVNKWLTDGTVFGSLTFDLGSNFSVGSTDIWNYGGGCCSSSRSVRELGEGVRIFV